METFVNFVLTNAKLVTRLNVCHVLKGTGYRKEGVYVHARDDTTCHLKIPVTIVKEIV